MPTVGTAELTLQERGILASSASAAYLDHFSSADAFWSAHSSSQSRSFGSARTTRVAKRTRFNGRTTASHFRRGLTRLCRDLSIC